MRKKLKVILVLLAGSSAACIILLPIRPGPPHGHQGARMRDTGSGIFKTLFAADLSTPDILPEPGEYQTSTEYWRAIVAKDIGISFRHLAGAGQEPYTGSDPNGFTVDHNGWCVVEGATKLPAGTPFLISANIQWSSLGQEPVLRDSPLLNKEVGVIITCGGLGYAVKPKGLAELAERNLDNKILQP